MSRYELFDRKQLKLRPLSERGSDMTIDKLLPLQSPEAPIDTEDFRAVVSAIRTARQNKRPVIVMMGGHPIKLGLSRFLIDLIEKGWITHIAMNGAGLIHDTELSFFGETSENVSKWIQEGQFGLWHESSLIHGIAKTAYSYRFGLGEAAGLSCLPHSICAAALKHKVPATIHVTIGGDIVYEHEQCDGMEWGQASYTDFLIFARTIQDLEGGVFLNIGTAVTGPEVYLKALSMARNVAHQRGKSIKHFTTAVFDLVPLPDNWREGTPPKTDPFYYYRPWKTILTRTVQDGGQSYHIHANHLDSIPSLWHHLTSDLNSASN